MGLRGLDLSVAQELRAAGQQKHMACRSAKSPPSSTATLGTRSPPDTGLLAGGRPRARSLHCEPHGHAWQGQHALTLGAWLSRAGAEPTGSPTGSRSLHIPQPDTTATLALPRDAPLYQCPRQPSPKPSGHGDAFLTIPRLFCCLPRDWKEATDVNPSLGRERITPGLCEIWHVPGTPAACWTGPAARQRAALVASPCTAQPAGTMVEGKERRWLLCRLEEVTLSCPRKDVPKG